MGIGVSVFLMALGAIFTFAVEFQVAGLDISVIGVILMIAGAIGLAVTAMVFGRRDRTVGTETVVEERRPTRTVEREVI